MPARRIRIFPPSSPGCNPNDPVCNTDTNEMPPLLPKDAMSTKTRAFSLKYVQWTKAQRWPILLLTAVVTVVTALYTAKNLQINNDLASLLPTHTPSVIALQEANQRFGASDKFMIAIQSSDIELVAALQDSIKSTMQREWSDILVTAQVEQSSQFFEDHALLYLPTHHLERIRDNLVTLQRRMGSEAGPLVVDLTGDGKNDLAVIVHDRILVYPQE